MTTKFTSKWMKNPLETLRSGGAKSDKSTSVTFGPGISRCFDREKRPDLAYATTNLLVRLQAGSKWLISQHQQFRSGATTAVSDERFAASLDLFWAEEQTLRRIYGFEGCVFGPGEACPKDAPIPCEGCF